MASKPAIKRATILEVARLAGVSKATVARSFTGEAPVAPATRQAVMRAAKAIGYEPNLLARGLRGGRTHSVGVLWSLGRRNSEGVVREFAKRLADRAYITYVADCLADPDILDEALTSCAGRGVEAIITQASGDLYKDPRITAHFHKFKAVVLVMDQLPSQTFAPPVDLVTYHTEKVIHKIVDYWVATGRRSLKFAGHPVSAAESAQPFVQRLRYHGLPSEDAIIHPGEYQRPCNTVNQFWEAYNAYFARHPMCDAILASSDDGAAAALLWLRHHGLSVPDDVAVMGSNNSDMMRVTTPPLASIETNGMNMVSVAMELLFQRLEDGDRTSQCSVIPMQMVWRPSAGPLLPGMAPPDDTPPLLQSLLSV